jgi:general secretion pathway protein D
MVASLLFGSSTASADDDLSAVEQLTKAIELYDAGDYEGSRQLLRDIDPDKLTDENSQLQHQKYLADTLRAIQRVADARQDLDDGRAALDSGDLARAGKKLDKVLDNQFAPQDVADEARALRRELDAQLEAIPAPSLSAQDVRSEGDSSLLSELSEEYELLWQQAEKTYRDTSNKIRKAILQNDFQEAHRLMDFAKQTLDLNRRYASPASRYEDYRNQALELERYIEEEERAWQVQEMKEKLDEVAQRERERLDRLRSIKARRIDGLMDQASELRKEHRYEDAIQVLEQILVLDPENDQAAWMRETLEDLAMGLRDKDAVKTRSTEIQGLLIENDEAMIPWHEHLIYPKNWPEISAKRFDEAEAAEPEENRAVQRVLEKAAPELRFDAIEFQEVITQLRQLTGLNIVPNWMALEAMAIEKDVEVTLQLRQGVKFSKALELILDEVGAGEVELGYTIDEGVIQISTREDLSRKTVVRVYNVQDLIISVPTFRGRQINLDQIGQSQQEGGIGGGRYLRGQGGSGGSNSQGLFGGSGNQNDDEDTDTEGDPLEPIIELIQQTIDPESWREAGGNVGSIQSLNQQIIVTQTSENHGELRDLLQQLRRARALQVAVEARYITISRNWLEQIGVDLDIILNNGNAGYDRTTILDPASGNPILVPREFTRLGFTPGAPGNVGINLPTQPFGQPYGQPGLVPSTGSVGPASGTMTRIPMVNNTLDLAAPSDTNIQGSLGSLVNQTPAFQIFGSFLDNIQVDFLLRASQVDRRSSDLDAPRLVLFNGQRATFESFIEQDYIAALTPIIGDNAGAFLPNIDTALTGRSLDVQATVSADRRYVTMTVRTFTRVTGDFRTVFFGGSQTVGSGFVELATQTTQQIRTTVSVPDGGTLLIGGLKLSGERDVDAGVPILSRIPILKRAFSNTSNVKDDQILLILLKPTIIIQEEAEAEAFPTLSAITGR